MRTGRREQREAEANAERAESAVTGRSGAFRDSGSTGGAKAREAKRPGLIDRLRAKAAGSPTKPEPPRRSSLSTEQDTRPGSVSEVFATKTWGEWFAARFATPSKSVLSVSVRPHAKPAIESFAFA